MPRSSSPPATNHADLMSLSLTTKTFAKSVAVPVALTGTIAASVRRTRSRLVDNTERVRIDAPPEAVWTYISDFENHWGPSNPEHAGTHVPSEPKMPLRDGLRFVQHERAGEFMGTPDATL